MKAINFKTTMLLWATIFFAAACSNKNDSYRTGTNENTSPRQAGNAEPGARTDTVTANGTMYQGGSANGNNSMQNNTSTVRDNTSQQPQTGTEMNKAQGNTNISNSDRAFAKEAYKGGRMEVRMGNIATERAQSTRVKDFANMMIRDHTKANNDLEATLGSLNLMTEVEKENTDDSHMEDMRSKTGRDFDIAYMRMMVNDHNKDIILFKKESSNGSNSALKDFATRTLPTLEMHLDSAKAVYGSLNGANTTRH